MRKFTLILVIVVALFAAGCGAEQQGRTENASGWHEFFITMNDGSKVPCVSNTKKPLANNYAFDCNWDAAENPSKG